ncbi:hypothetical protein ACWCQK_24080 [Streptomyces sp. NPDC002306]
MTFALEYRPFLLDVEVRTGSRDATGGARDVAPAFAERPDTVGQFAAADRRFPRPAPEVVGN